MRLGDLDEREGTRDREREASGLNQGGRPTKGTAKAALNSTARNYPISTVMDTEHEDGGQ